MCLTQQTLWKEERRLLGGGTVWGYYKLGYCLTLFFNRIISSTLKMEVTRSSGILVYSKPTWRHIPEDSILHSHRRENLKSYIVERVTSNACTMREILNSYNGFTNPLFQLFKLMLQE
jgi:hypothetical protein